MDACVEKSPTLDWYATVPGEAMLEQGDLLDNFPILVPEVSLVSVPSEPVDQEVGLIGKILRFNVVVMTQSCDLLNLSDEEDVILCPRYAYKDAAEAHSSFRGRDGWSNLVKGRFIQAHMINKCDIAGHEFDYQVIDIRRIFSVPLSIVRQVAVNQGGRVRILPPYREHLAQAFARQFMRIGLPVDLPRESPFA